MGPTSLRRERGVSTAWEQEYDDCSLELAGPCTLKCENTYEISTNWYKRRGLKYMHIPGLGFGRVHMMTDRNSRIGFADLQGQFFKGGISNYNCKPFFQILCACSPSLPCVARSCSSSLFLVVGLATMVTRCVRVAGTIVILVC